MDVLWVRDDPKLRAQEDPFHYQKARELGRYLLTHDEDFWNDQQYSLHTCPGLIILPKNSESIAKYFPAFLRTFMRHYNPMPEPIYLDEIKIRLSWESITIKMLDGDTQKKTIETWTWQELRLKGKA